MKVQERKDGVKWLALTKAFNLLGWKKGDKIKEKVEGGNIVLKKDD